MTADSTRLPFHKILQFCDGKATINALCVSDIYRKIVPSDLVKSFALRHEVGDFHRVPETFWLLYIKTCLDLGKDVRAQNDYALRWASGNGHLDLVQFLVSKGADVRALDDYALRCASENGHLDVVQYLVSKGVDVRALNESVKCASYKGRLEVVQFLLSKGAEVQNNWAIVLAKRMGHHDVVQFLILKGASYTDAVLSLRCGPLDVLWFPVSK